MNFKSWLITEISQNTILYHRSNGIFSVGEILDPSSEHKGNHWLKAKPTELFLEKFRKEFAPEKPSRLNCIYCSVVPRSVFISRKNLYEVKPIGNTHITLAYYINEIDNIFHNEISYNYMFDKLGNSPKIEDINNFKWEHNKNKLIPLFNKYWNTASRWNEDSRNLKKDPKWIEVLCEKVEIVKKIKETEDEIFRKGDKVVFTQDVEDDFLGYDSTGNKKLSDQEKNRIIQSFNGRKGRHGEYFIKIPKGTIGTIGEVKYYEQIPKGINKDYHSMQNYQSGKSMYKSIKVQPNGFDFNINLRDNADWIAHFPALSSNSIKKA